MQFSWERRAKAVHFYSRESVSAIPRIRAAGNVQAWRSGDGECANPVYVRQPLAPASIRQPALSLAA
jgi:hypothetical protein